MRDILSSGLKRKPRPSTAGAPHHQSPSRKTSERDRAGGLPAAIFGRLSIGLQGKKGNG